MAAKPDLMLAGAGLANALIALRISERHPGARIVMFEAGANPGGEHTWSFHGGDLNHDQHRFIAPLVVKQWPNQQVRFPAHSRTIENRYLSTTTGSLNAAISEAASIEVRCNSAVRTLDATSITLADGTRLEGKAVIDGRGPQTREGLVLGYQKFVGHEVETADPHGLSTPIIMDATVDQTDGYRFVYVLPFDKRRLLIEDTYYSDGSELSETALADRIEHYARQQGWTIERWLRQEQGILPILLAADFDRFWPQQTCCARAGLNAALFHPTTGYSLPQAVGLADRIADAWPLNGAELAKLTRNHAQEFCQRTGFFRLLNRMLFRAGQPDQRYRVLQRFYQLDDHLITNFYATSLRLRDRVRLLAGKPPVPIHEALTVMNETAFLKRELSL